MSFTYGAHKYSEHKYSWLPSWLRAVCNAGSWVAQACRLDTRRNQDVPGNQDHADISDPQPQSRKARGQWY